MSLDAVRALHVSTVYPSGAVVCAEDGFDWPCRTAVALDADVAAAPPSDEPRDLDLDVETVREGVAFTDSQEVIEATERLITRLYDAAPPAGHEDEAAVERAARAILALRYPTADLTRLPRLAWAEAANEYRAALAAARGPRTPDPAPGGDAAPVPVVAVCGPPADCTCPAVAWTCICGARRPKKKETPRG